jgi:hypothetical protein
MPAPSNGIESTVDVWSSFFGFEGLPVFLGCAGWSGLPGSG